MAVLLTGDWHTAEDLVQTCLAKLYRVWDRLDTGVDPDSYLRRMLVNTQRSWWRARWRSSASGHCSARSRRWSWRDPRVTCVRSGRSRVTAGPAPASPSP
jgi:DNA-directed RNA polymerase specialized sigma24 family protein